MEKKLPQSNTKEPWYILTNLGSLTGAIQAYKKIMGIEEMFRDCKSGGYNLEGSGLRGNRLNSTILVISLAYLKSNLQWYEINRNQKKICLLSKEKRENLSKT